MDPLQYTRPILPDLSSMEESSHSPSPELNFQLIHILFAVLFLFLSKFIHGIFAVPTNLQHLPRVSTWRLLKSYLSTESDDVRIKRLLLPFADRGEPVVLVWLLGTWTVHLLDQESALPILKDTEAFPKQLPSMELLFWRLLGPTSITITNGEAWRKNSLIVREGFKSVVPIPTLAKLSKGLVDIIGANLERAVDFSELALRFALDAVSSTLIGHDFHALHQESAFVSNYNSIISEIANPVYIFFPRLERLLPRKSLAKRIDRLGDDIMGLLSSKRASPGKDFMSIIMNHPDMKDQDRRDNLVTLIFAGHETTTGAISSVMYYLAQNADCQAKARAEVLDILGSRMPSTATDLKGLEYVDACVRESLRCNPPGAFLVPRVSSTPTRVGKYTIPASTFMFINLYTILLSKNTCPDPHKFVPERFLKGNTTIDFWIPFSRGARQCPAKAFAMCELKILLCILLREYSWRLPENSKHRNGLKNGLSSFSILAPQSLEIIFTKWSDIDLAINSK